MTIDGSGPAHHALASDETRRRLDATATGLTGAEAARRLARLGPNRLPLPPRQSPWLRFLAHFNNVLIYVLLAAAVVTGALQHWVDTGVILAVVLVNAIIGCIQEGRAEQAMAAIRGMLAPRSAVLRDGRRQNVDAADRVPGDVVLVEAGDRVPADLRLLEARGLTAEEAILTGESVPVDKSREPVPELAALGDQASMLVSALFLCAVFGVYLYAIDKGYAPALAQTMAMNMLVVLEVFHLFFIRNIHGTSLTWAAARGTRVVWASVLAVTAAQFAITYLPPLQAVFGSAAVPILDGMLIVGIGAVFFALIEAEKRMRLALRNRHQDASLMPKR